VSGGGGEVEGAGRGSIVVCGDIFMAAAQARRIRSGEDGDDGPKMWPESDGDGRRATATDWRHDRSRDKINAGDRPTT
jgi:hypothetical protein